MQAVRTIFLFFGAVFALLLIAIGIVGYLVTGPAAREVGANAIPITEEAVQSLDDKIDVLEQEVDAAIARGEHRLHLLIITEEEATSKIQALSDEGETGVDIDHIQIRFIDGRVHAFAKIDVVISLQVSLQAEIEVNDGEVEIKVVRFNVGRVSIPSTLIDQVMRAVMGRVHERLEADIDIELEQITVENGQMIVAGITK
ncbi:hypothetical protein ES703_03274 [subsurface metagenome]